MAEVAVNEVERGVPEACELAGEEVLRFRRHARLSIAGNDIMEAAG